MNHAVEWNDQEDKFAPTLSQRTEELYRVPNLEADPDGLVTAVVLPLRDLVVFPRMLAPIFVGREASLLAIQEAQAANHPVIGMVQKDAELEDPQPADFLDVGIEMAVGRLLAMPDSSSSALVQGRRRLEIVEFVESPGLLSVRGRPVLEFAQCRSANAGADAVGARSLRPLCSVGSVDPRRSAHVCHEYL